jgi:hypothetical protein
MSTASPLRGDAGPVRFLLLWIAHTGLTVVAVAIASVLSLLLARHTRLQHHLGDNDVAGLIFGVIGILYGPLRRSDRLWLGKTRAASIASCVLGLRAPPGRDQGLVLS